MSRVPELILASRSPRRAQLLRERGIAFTVATPPEDDPSGVPPGCSPIGLARALSLQKAVAVANGRANGLILAGDTVAAIGDEVFGKPNDRADAERILRAITGTSHEVITALTLLDAASMRQLTRHDTTTIVMRELSDDELSAYLDTGAWEGKAGAYGIQDHGDAFVTRIKGSFTNVVGLPMELLDTMLAEWSG